MKKIVFTGGGTAGHIMPNIALIDELKEYEKYYIGSNGMEKKLISNRKDIEFIEIPSVKLKRSLSPSNLLLPFKLINAINKAKKILKNIKPDLIFSKGGYVSLPVCLAGNSLNIPVITHESDLSIGLANKLIAKKAKYVCCSFKKTADSLRHNGIFTGSPIRKKILSGNKQNINKKFKLTNGKHTILIVGGSQGAQHINEIIWNNLKELSNQYNILHIVGKNKINKSITKENYDNYYQIEFADDIENYFAAADVVITRAGSNTIFELLAIEKPMILIPLPKSKHSRGDQVDNANYFKSNNLALSLEQSQLTYSTLTSAIKNILKNKEKFMNNIKNANKNIGNSKIIQIIKETIDV